MTTDETTSVPAEAPKTRKPRAKKWASELARQNHSNQRRKLAREASERETAALDAARADLRFAQDRLNNVEANRRQNMVGDGLAPRLRGVMNSWGLTLPVTLTPHTSISAWTDFSQINVTYDRRLTNMERAVNEDGSKGDVLPLNPEKLRQIAAETRGLFYHEVGHNLFTVPLPELLLLAWKQDPKAVEAIAAENGCISISEPSVPGEDPSIYAFGYFQQSWNCQEDQRMETSLVNESPVLAGYLTVLVMRQILSDRGAGESAWALVAGRSYLPDAVREAAREAWHHSQVVAADAVAAVIDRYLSATDALSMIQAVEDFRILMDGNRIPGTPDDHNQFGDKPKNGKPSNERVSGAPKPKASKDKDESDKNEDEDGTPVSMPGAGQDDESDEGEGDGSGEGQESDEKADESEGASKGDDDGDVDDDAPTGSGIGNGHRENPSNASPKAAAKDALNDLLDSLADDENLTDDIASMNEAYNVDEGNLPAYSFARPLTDSNLISKASSVVDDLVQAFSIATADCAPHWESGQRRGVLEPMRYRTRQPGDLEIFRQYTDEGEPGTDIAVSVFLDVSGSMDGDTEALGAAAWATKMACQTISVDCDVTLFDTSAWRLYGTEEYADAVPAVQAHGGTNPQAAFDAVLSDERDKQHHLVLIMTDGGWSDLTVMRRYKKANTFFMVFNYSSYYASQGMTPDEGSATRLGADEAYQIGDLLDIPRALESMLVSLV